MAKTCRQTAHPRQGTVVRNTGSAYIVRLSDGSRVAARVKGNFRIRGIRTTNPVAVGDEVDVVRAADDADHIVAIRPRRNYIIRRASNLSKESHILAANLDQVMLVATLREPVTTTTFIDRFLATAEAYAIPAVLVLNKSDLWDTEDRELATAMKVLYEGIGYDVIFLSAIAGEGVGRIKELAHGNRTLIAGNSGVGKSTLINDLVPGACLRTGQVSGAHHTGMHTTTFSEMLDLPEGGEIIDVPGVKGFGVIEFEPAEVSHYFPEIFRIGQECRYSDCLHVNEPGCAVIPSVRDHLVSESRYASYLSVLEEAMEKAGSDKYRKPF